MFLMTLFCKTVCCVQMASSGSVPLSSNWLTHEKLMLLPLTPALSGLAWAKPKLLQIERLRSVSLGQPTEGDAYAARFPFLSRQAQLDEAE